LKADENSHYMRNTLIMTYCNYDSLYFSKETCNKQCIVYLSSCRR